MKADFTSRPAAPPALCHKKVQSQAPPRVGPHPPALTPTWPPPLSLLVSLTLLKEPGAFIRAPRVDGVDVDAAGRLRLNYPGLLPVHVLPAVVVGGHEVQQEGVHGVGIRPGIPFTFSTGNILLKEGGRSWRTPMGS